MVCAHPECAFPLLRWSRFVLMLPALGVALVKPSVVGTTARASKENVRSVGYSIYYTLVNVGSTLGPLLAAGSKTMADQKMYFESQH